MAQVAASPMASSKAVALPERAAPWKPSFHQLYAGTPICGIAAATSCICEHFSSMVIRETRSFTRFSRGRLASRYAARVGSFTDEGFSAVWAIKVDAEKSRKKIVVNCREKRLNMAKILSQSMPGVHSGWRAEPRVTPVGKSQMFLISISFQFEDCSHQ